MRGLFTTHGGYPDNRRTRDVLCGQAATSFEACTLVVSVGSSSCSIPSIAGILHSVICFSATHSIAQAPFWSNRFDSSTFLRHSERKPESLRGLGIFSGRSWPASLLAELVVRGN